MLNSARTVTDSPSPSAENNANTFITAMNSQFKSNNNTLVQMHFPSPLQTCLVSPIRLSPTPSLHIQIQQHVENQLNDHQKAKAISDQDVKLHELCQSRALVEYKGIPSNIIDSAAVRPDKRSAAVTYVCKSAPLIHEVHSDSLSGPNTTLGSTPELPFLESSNSLALLDTLDSTLELPFSESSNSLSVCDKTLGSTSEAPISESFDSLSVYNRTLGSTPELPVSESSDSLDIPFASLFDLMDFSQLLEDLPPAMALFTKQGSSDFDSFQNHGSPVLPNDNCLQSHMNYCSMSSVESSVRQSTFRSAVSAYNLEKPEMTVSHANALLQPHFVYHKQVIAGSLTKSVARSAQHTSDSYDFNIDENYELHLRDTHDDSKSEKELDMDKNDKSHAWYTQADIKSVNEYKCFPQRPMTATEFSKLRIKPQSAEINATLLSSSATIKIQPGLQLSALNGQCTHNKENKVQCKSSFMNSVNCDNLSSTNISWSYYDLPDAPQNSMTNQSTGKAPIYVSSRNVSWPYHVLPEAPLNNTANFSNHREGNRKSNDYCITVRPKLPISLPEVVIASENGSASKRRRGNNKVGLAVNSSQQDRTPRRARQRLAFTSPAKPKHADSIISESDFTNTLALSPLSSYTRGQTASGEKHRSLPSQSQMLQKENKSQYHVYRSKRKPLAELENVRLCSFEATASSSSTVSISPGSYAKANKASLDHFLPSRTEDLLSRDAYYCDFTVDRQQKIDDFISRKVHTSISHENRYTLHDTATNEILVRKVEGAENSHLSFVFQAPSPNLRVPKTAAHVHKQRLRSDIYTKVVSKWPQNRHGVSDGNSVKIDRSSHMRMHGKKCICPHSSEHSERGSSVSCYSHCPSGNRSSSRRPSQKSCTTHPIASSTMLTESSSCSIDSFSTLSDGEEFSSSNLEKSYLCSKSLKKKRELKSRVKIQRSPASFGENIPPHLLENGQDTRTFDISTMVSHIDPIVNTSRVILGKKMDSVREDRALGISKRKAELEVSKPTTPSSKYIMAEPQSFIKTVNTASSNGSLHYSEISSGKSSNVSSKQATTSSMFLNHAKASAFCSSIETSDIQAQGNLSCGHVRTKPTSTFAPGLYCQKRDTGISAVVPRDIDTMPDGIFENRHSISEQSSVTGGSFNFAGRCRSIHAGRLQNKPIPSECSTQSERDLLDSILTDSPKSVNTSGILAPYNSYSGPVENVGSHHAYCNKASSCDLTKTWSEVDRVKTQLELIVTPVATPHFKSIGEKNMNTSDFVSKPQSRAESHDNEEFKCPYSPALHINSVINQPSTSSQDVPRTVTCIPFRPVSVNSDPLGRKSAFAAPTRVITGPPKIKNKNSLVRKFRKFSSNFCKKTEKIHILGFL